MPVLCFLLVALASQATVDTGYPPWSDAIASYNGSIVVYNYTGSNMSAIIVYDSILRGEERLIYASFPLMD